MIVFIFVGLPGSGKSFNAKKEYEKYGGILLDDKFSADSLLNAIMLNENMYITDPALCYEKERKSFIEFLKKYKNIEEIRFTYFENNLEKAWNNIVNRNDGRIFFKDIIQRTYCKNYKIPENVETKAIWESNGNN